MRLRTGAAVPLSRPAVRCRPVSLRVGPGGRLGRPRPGAVCAGNPDPAARPLHGCAPLKRKRAWPSIDDQARPLPGEPPTDTAARVRSTCGPESPTGEDRASLPSGKEERQGREPPPRAYRILARWRQGPGLSTPVRADNGQAAGVIPRTRKFFFECRRDGLRLRCCSPACPGSAPSRTQGPCPAPQGRVRSIAERRALCRRRRVRHGGSHRR